MDKENNFNRRNFLSNTAMAAGIGALASAPAVAAGIVKPGQSNSSQSSKSKEFTDKVAFITGGARGIGRGAALELAKKGANIAIFDIASQLSDVPYPLASRKDLFDTKKDVESYGVKCLTFEGDVRNRGDLEYAVEKTVKKLGSLDFLFANAGITHMGSVETLSDSEMELVLDINLKGVIRTVQVAAPYMKNQKSGRIVTTASITGRGAGPMFPLYSTAKWGVIGFTKNAAHELAKFNITCNTITPSIVRTKLLLNDYILNAFFPHNPTEEEFDKMAKQGHLLPVGMIEIEDVGKTVTYLFSEGSKYITGDVFDIQGGMNATSIG